ncbi:MAG: CHASE2 domain-containing protein [Solirubrobacteraceae bacterium]
MGRGRVRRRALGNRRLRQLLVLVGALLAASLAISGYETGALNQVELPTVDARFLQRGDGPVPSDVAVVAIDTPSFQQLGVQWPFPRSLHARVIDVLRRAGARAIVYDVQFTEASRPEEDRALFEAVARAGNVVLATTEVGPGGSTNVLGGDANLRAAHALAGNANYSVDRGAVFRQVPYSVDGLRTLAVQATGIATGQPVDRALFPGGKAWIDYVGGAGRVTTVSFSRVLESGIPPGAFRGKVVVVGATTPSLQDIHGTPTDHAMPGAEIQANAIHTLLHRVPLREITPSSVNPLLIALLALVPALLFLGLPFLAAVIASVAVGLIYAFGAQLAFDANRIVSVVYPLGALTLSTVAAIGVSYITEIRERLRTRNAFRRFIPADVVDQVLAQADDELRLGGIEAEGTVMFSDVRGFTTFSESQEPARVIEFLNRYLSEMTDAILDHGGTLVSYMGDGIMAVFGAPLAQTDHADRALASACEMLAVRLPRFNAWAREQGIEEPFKIGIGVNSGKFMAGNVGSLQRLEYTVIGDTTNTAARLEGMTKGSGHALFIAESTRLLLREGGPPLRFVDELPVRGRKAPIRIWALADEQPPRQEDERASEQDPVRAL